MLLKSLKVSSAVIQFIDNGQIEVTSSRALRRIARQGKPPLTQISSSVM